MSDVLTIYVPELSITGRRLGHYQWDVVCSGHVPGVLSGTELRGRARKYGAGYAQSRRRVIDGLAKYSVVPGMAKCPEFLEGPRAELRARPAKVWTDAWTGERVRIQII